MASSGQVAAQEKRAARFEIVPVDPLRDRFLQLERAGEITARQLASRLDEAGHKGFVRKSSPSQQARYHAEFTPDATRVKRMLGVKSCPQDKRRKDGTRYAHTIARYMRYEYAVTLAEILGMTPVDAGV